jgi:hypothetical protein
MFCRHRLWWTRSLHSGMQIRFLKRHFFKQKLERESSH